MKYSTVERQRTAGGSTPTYEVQNSRIVSLNKEIQCKLQDMERKKSRLVHNV